MAIQLGVLCGCLGEVGLDERVARLTKITSMSCNVGANFWRQIKPFTLDLMPFKPFVQCLFEKLISSHNSKQR